MRYLENKKAGTRADRYGGSRRANSLYSGAIYFARETSRYHRAPAAAASRTQSERRRGVRLTAFEFERPSRHSPRQMHEGQKYFKNKAVGIGRLVWQWTLRVGWRCNGKKFARGE